MGCTCKHLTVLAPTALPSRVDAESSPSSWVDTELLGQYFQEAVLLHVLCKDSRCPRQTQESPTLGMGEPSTRGPQPQRLGKERAFSNLNNCDEHFQHVKKGEPFIVFSQESKLQIGAGAILSLNLSLSIFQAARALLGPERHQSIQVLFYNFKVQQQSPPPRYQPR